MPNIFQLLTPCAKIEVLEMFEDKDFNKTGFNAESTMMKESYDEMLDEMGVSVLKGYDASRLLRETDPIAYEVGMNDYESSILAEVQELNTEGNLEHALAFMFDDDEELTPEGEKNLKEMYDDMLDEMGVEVMLNNYDASRLLEETDPIAYRVGLSDYESSMESDMYDDMSPYEKIARRNVGMAESSLTRLTSDHPKFDPQKADRNKDGKISSWERTVGNEVAKSMGADEVAYPVEWEDVRIINKYPIGDNNDGLIYGIEYMDGEMVSDVEWFATAKERDAELKSYIEEFGEYDAESFEEDDGLMCVICGEHFFGDECPYIGEHTQEEIDNAYNTVGSLYYAESFAAEYDGRDLVNNDYIDMDLNVNGQFAYRQYTHIPKNGDGGRVFYCISQFEIPIEEFLKRNKKYIKTTRVKEEGMKEIPITTEWRPKGSVYADAESSLVRQAKGIDTLAEPFEEIGIPLPYARLGVMAAGLTALAFGVKKYMKK